jgi:uncharacterized membrane protein YfcA
MLELTALALGAAVGIAVFAGVVKGVVGFAMPMIMISGLSTFMSPDLALAGLILPTVVANTWQAVRGGLRAVAGSMREHWLYISIVAIFIALSAQLVTVLSDRALYLILGLPVTAFAMMQLFGWRIRFRPEHRRRAEVLIAAFAGFVGGISGIWGPPTVAYLTALDTPKAEQLRVQGVVYGIGAFVLLFAHLNSGILTVQTAGFSAALVLPAVVGMLVGFRIQDRMDQALFRQATLAVLIVAGLNLIRRGLMG